MRCAECGGTMERTLDPIFEEFRGEEVTLRGIEHYACRECGEIVLDADALDEWSRKLDEAYREMHGLMRPDEIKSLRKSHGLTQREFEKVLGVSSPTVSRWETGKVCQTKSMDRFMRVLRNHPEEVSRLAMMEEIGAGSSVRATVVIDMPRSHPTRQAARLNTTIMEA